MLKDVSFVSLFKVHEFRLNKQLPSPRLNGHNEKSVYCSPHHLIRSLRLKASQFLSIPRNTSGTAYSFVCLEKLEKTIASFRRSLIAFRAESPGGSISPPGRTREY